MIVVLAGTNPYSFERLVKPLDELAGKHGWDVFMQLGHTELPLRHSKSVAFIGRSELVKMIEQAELVVTHGGFGSIRDALFAGKAVVAVPRRPEFNESQDYQEELVRELEESGYVIGVYDIVDLESAIERARSFVPGKLEPSRIPALIDAYLSQLNR